MKNHFQKKIFIALVISILFITQCSSPTLPTESKPSIDISYSQNTEFEITEYQLIDAESIQIDSLYVQVAYELSKNRWILIGNSIYEDPTGLKLLLIDPMDDNKLLYRSKGAYESLILFPTFFKSSNSDDPTIILCSLGQMVPWGQELFLMKNDTIVEIDYMDVVMKVKADTTLYDEDDNTLKDIGPFTKINKTETGIHFTFETDSILFYGSKDDVIDPILSGGALKYTYFNGELSMEWAN